MAVIKAIYENQADIPEQFVDLFEERQGKWLLVNIEGMTAESDVHRVTTANTNLRNELKETKEKLKAFGERKPEDYDTLTHELEEAKAMIEAGGGGKLDEEKIEKLVSTRVNTQVAPVKRELETTKNELLAEKEKASKLESRITRSVINDAVRTAAVENKVLPSAIDDIMLLAPNIFEVVDVDGKEKVVTKDGIGVTPGQEPAAYITEVAPKKPHWFAGSVGAGANGGAPGGSNLLANNPWSAQHWNLTEQGKVIKEKGEDQAKRIAASVGSHLGATKPPSKK